MAYWKAVSENAMAEIRSIEQKINSLDLEAAAWQKILNTIQQAKDVDAGHIAGLNQWDSMLEKIGGRLLQITTTMLLLRTLKSMWTEAVQFAQQYYDKLNEIQVVTMQSDAQIQKLGTQYRAMAKELSVTATEIAKAAVEFFRQGLPSDQVTDRLKYTTQYAKIAA